MWLLSDTDGKKVLCSEPEHVLQLVRNRNESYNLEWIAVYEPPDESEKDNPYVKIGQNYEPIPLSRAKETEK